MNKRLFYVLIFVLFAFAGLASAGNPPNPCGNHGNNCDPSGPAATSSANAGALAVGVGIGYGQGGDATANGGTANSANTNTALGGAGFGGAGGDGGRGGDGGTGFGGIGMGGDANQGQQQSNSNVGINGQKQSSENTNVNGQQQSIADSGNSTQGQSLDNKVSNDTAVSNSAVGSGNETAVNVDASDNSVNSIKYERNAPPVYLGALAATASCSGSFNVGGSDRNGSGAFGFTWISKDCRSVVTGRDFQQIGMLDVACRIWKTTKGFQRAAKADPSLKDVDCSMRPKAE